MGVGLGTLVEPLSGRRCERQELETRLDAAAADLHRRGLAPSDRVFVHFGNSIEFFVDVLAVWRLGGCVVPVDPRLSSFEIATLAEAARPRLSLWQEPPDSRTASALEGLGVTALVESERGTAPVDVSLPSHSFALDDDALILFTSGTTGNPKGVVHTHRSLRARWTTLGQSLGHSSFRRTLCLLPTHFGHGLICNCLFPWLSGAELHLLPPFRGDIVAGLGALVDRHQISFLSSVPSVWRLALRTARPPEGGSLERVFCGSAPLSRAMWQQIQEWSGTPDVANAYGITETGSWTAGTTDGPFEPEDGLVGAPWGASVAVVRGSDPERPPSPENECEAGEEGDVWLATPALMKEYLDRPDLTAEVVRHGWFVTGDIGLLDERGRLYLRGRKREEINKGGMKVYPGDIDTAVEQFGGVVDVCTFAIDDPLYGQNVGVAVTLEEPHAQTLASLRSWLEDRIAPHQLPVRWYVLDEIPRTSRGKVNRAQIAGVCAERQPALGQAQ